MLEGQNIFALVTQRALAFLLQQLKRELKAAIV